MYTGCECDPPAASLSDKETDLLAIAAIKGRRILLDYLDLRSAPALWRGLATAWLMLIVGFAWAASAVSVLLPSP